MFKTFIIAFLFPTMAIPGVIHLASLEHCFRLDLSQMKSTSAIHGAFGPIEANDPPRPESILGQKSNSWLAGPDERRFPLQLCISAAKLTVKNGNPVEITLTFDGLDPKDRFQSNFSPYIGNDTHLKLEKKGDDQILIAALPVIAHKEYHPMHPIWVMLSILNIEVAISKEKAKPKVWAEVRQDPLQRVPQTASLWDQAPYILEEPVTINE